MQTWERIVESLKQEPGQSAAAVGRRIDVDASTASYHLRRLEREGKTSSSDFGRETVWFSGSCKLCPVLKRAVPAMRRAEVAAVARAMSEAPAPSAQIAREAGVPEGKAAWAFKVLEDAGLGKRSGTGKVQLIEGGEICVARAVAHEPCPLWGSCAPSKSAITGLRQTSWRL